MENLTKILFNLQEEKFANKFTLKFENDDVVFCMQKSVMHLIAGVESAKGLATSSIEKGKVVDFRVRRVLPKIVIDYISTIGKLSGKQIIPAHMSKLSQRRSFSDEGGFVDVEIKFGIQKLEVYIKDVFEDREYMIICEDFKTTPSKCQRYEIRKNYIKTDEEIREEETVSEL